MVVKKAKPRKCKGPNCPREGGLFIPRPGSSFQTTCDIPCALEYKRIRDQEKARKNAKKAVVELNRNTVKWQHKQTQRVFNRMRVLQEIEWFKNRGLEPVCISCGKTKMDWACGHYVPVGANGRLRYSILNTWLQCNMYCNSGQSGNREGSKTTKGYTQGLIDRFGEAGSRMIEELKCDNEPKKWTVEELERMRATFASEVRRLEGLGISSRPE